MNLMFLEILAAMHLSRSGMGRVMVLEGKTDTIEDIQASPKDQMPLTEEERGHLSSLSGKEKKSYLKELRAKYAQD
jgi:hypothetical protein